MEYTLPHAVLALLREEKTSPIPRSFFIRSGSRSTKITLIYSKRKQSVPTSCIQEARSTNRTQYRSQNRYVDNYHRLPRGKLSNTQSSGDSRGDFSKTANLRQQLQTGSNRSSSSSHCPTDTSSITNTSIDSHCVRPGGSQYRDGYDCDSSPNDNMDDENDPEDDDDDDYSNQYIALSPSCYGDEDKPVTPGRDFRPSESPRPPTPNLQNYDTIMASVNSNAQGDTPSRQATIEYDVSMSPPIISQDVYHPSSPRDFDLQTDNNINNSNAITTTPDNHRRPFRTSPPVTKSQRITSNKTRKSKSKSPNHTTVSSSKTSIINRKGRCSLSPAAHASLPSINIQTASPGKHNHHPHPHHPHHQQHQKQQQNRRFDMLTTSAKSQKRSIHRLQSWDGGRRTTQI